MTPQEKFITYIRTKQVFSLRLRGGLDEMVATHISTKEIEDRFFPFPKYKRKEEVQALVNNGIIKVTAREGKFYYEALKAGKIDLKLLIAKPMPPDCIYKTMLANLQKVSLPIGAESTEYFDLFLKYKDAHPQLFATVDLFAGRFHTPVSNFHRHLRPLILLDGMETTSYDLNCSQPLILARILSDNLGKNELSENVNSGKDIYLIYKDLAKLPDRETAKKAFLKSLFSPDLKLIPNLFGSTVWGDWITDFKSKPFEQNKRVKTLSNGKISYHNNLSYLLQKKEAEIMIKVWQKLADANIMFVSVHDSVIVQHDKANETEAIFRSVLDVEFPVYYQIHREGKQAPPKQPEPPSFDKIPNVPHTNKLWDLPTELIELQKHYSDMENNGKLQQHPRSQQIVELWQSVVNDYHTPQLRQHLNELSKLKAFSKNTN